MNNSSSIHGMIVCFQVLSRSKLRRYIQIGSFLLNRRSRLVGTTGASCDTFLGISEDLNSCYMNLLYIPKKI